MKFCGSVRATTDCKARLLSRHIAGCSSGQTLPMSLANGCLSTPKAFASRRCMVFDMLTAFFIGLVVVAALLAETCAVKHGCKPEIRQAVEIGPGVQAAH